MPGVVSVPAERPPLFFRFGNHRLRPDRCCYRIRGKSSNMPLLSSPFFYRALPLPFPITDEPLLVAFFFARNRKRLLHQVKNTSRQLLPAKGRDLFWVDITIPGSISASNVRGLRMS